MLKQYLARMRLDFSHLDIKIILCIPDGSYSQTGYITLNVPYIEGTFVGIDVTQTNCFGQVFVRMHATELLR